MYYIYNIIINLFFCLVILFFTFLFPFIKSEGEGT